MQVYAEVVVAKFSSSEQAEHKKLSALEGQPDRCNRRRGRLDELERHLMASPGVTFSTIRNAPIQSFKPIVNARGLLFANKQISQELKETHWSKNTVLIRIQEGKPLNTPYRDCTPLFAQTVKKLYLDVTTTEHHPGESGFQACVNTIKRQLQDIVTSLNRSGERLDSLTVNYTSCFPNEIEDLRVDADGLAAHEQARVIWVMDPRTDKMRSLNHTEMKELYLHSTTIADALCSLTIPVSSFRIFGDISGSDLARLSRKFDVPVPEVDVKKLDRYGQYLNARAEGFRDMATRNPQSAGTWMDMVRMHEQIFSTRALAIRNVALYGPSSSDPAYHRLMAQARSI